MFGNLCGKKVLLIGGIGPTADIIGLAHRNNVKVGVADYNKNTYVKSIADFVHDINILDVDAVVDLCTREKYDGVISNFNDMLLPYVEKVAQKLGFYVPYSEHQYLMSTNKKYFKETCKKYSVSTPLEYSYKDSSSLSEISLPVIVKPVDGSGSKGITICKTKEELISGIEKAKKASKCEDIVIEDYIDGDEINVTYIAQDGKIEFAAIHDRYFNTSQEGYVQVPDLYIYPSKYLKLYLETCNEYVLNMLHGLGIKNGSLFFQACVANDKIYIYEAGMRLNGCKTYQILEYENGYNTFERLLNYSLVGNMGPYVMQSPCFDNWYATINVLGKPGETIEKFEGIEELKTYPWLIHIARQFYEGETIPLNAIGTLLQDTTRIHISARTKDELIQRIKKVNDMYKLINPKGENIILEPHDLSDIRCNLNYNLKG